MKKIFAILAISSFVFTSCHYGEGEAKKTLDANEKYKTDKADYSVNRAEPSAPATEAPATTPADTTKK